jgi:glycosyltransferase involved in cell wall biosynthesis
VWVEAGVLGPKNKFRTDRIVRDLRAEGVATWFELGLLLDRLREGRRVPCTRAPKDPTTFRHKLARGVAFVTYEYAIDGVTMEIAKYAAALQRVLPDPAIHFVAGRFDSRAEAVLDPGIDCHVIDGLLGFDRCPHYESFFHKRLERGSPRYNRLITEFWESTLQIVEDLGHAFETNEIELVFAVNTNSNAGNPALSLALVLLSEHLGIPVLSNNHDFFWEGGNSEVDREAQGISKGPRDHFYTNAHLGEVFSVIQMTCQWEARAWISLNLNQMQCDELISVFGHNPINVMEVGTAVDTDMFAPLSSPRRAEILQQLAVLLGGKEHMVPVKCIGDAIQEGLSREEPRLPVLLGTNDRECVDFTRDNMILLQPTRIVARKRIGLVFDMLQQLFEDPEFADFFEATPSLKMTVIVTGPVADGQQRYFERLMENVREVLEELPASVRDRVFFAPLFAGLDAVGFRSQFKKPALISEVYGTASLVCLPSETEGRGLPIIEAAACGVPALVRRYQPEEVYAHVIGEHLAADSRLQVIEFSGQRVGREAIERTRDILLHPHQFLDVSRHNRKVVEGRYSTRAIHEDLAEAIDRLRLQLDRNKRPMELAEAALSRFRRRMHGAQRRITDLIDAEAREYLPGYGRMGFMLMLKSLIDPSYFRAEEQRIRGMAFSFARRLMEQCDTPSAESRKTRHDFYNTVDSLFLYHDGELPVIFDHSIAYRHRNRRCYPYRNLTPQELSSVINGLHQEACTSPSPHAVPHPAHHFSSWGLAIEQLCGGTPAIDQRSRLMSRLEEDRPVALIPGAHLELELELFLVQAVKSRLGLAMHAPLTPDDLKDAEIAPIYVIAREHPCADHPTTGTVKTLIAETPNEELKLIFRHRLGRIVASQQLGLGIDVREFGRRALNVLREVKEGDGFVIACAEQSASTTDILDIERFHVGRAEDPFAANLLGIRPGEGFVQWVPAGLRFSLAYPTPIQTGLSLAGTLESPRFRRLCDEMGESVVLATLRDDAAARGTPVARQLDVMELGERADSSRVEEQAIGGLYDDGQPWSGNLARVGKGDRPLRYRILSSDHGPRTVVEFVEGFEGESGETAQIAWNGGYILNAELVGKLGLPEAYIGSPLGLIISGGRVVCPPLYEKPALTVDSNGMIEIRRVTCAGGLRITTNDTRLTIPASGYNPSTPPDEACYYDLLHSDDMLPGNGRTLVRLAGSRIMEIVSTVEGQDVPVFPVGLTLSIPAGPLPSGFEEGAQLQLELLEFVGIEQAVEAGPLLVENGEVAIDMELEGWKTANSIRTQAARLDYLDMRGPKIAVGLNEKGCLMVLTVNGRIRESVGATHVDMAKIMQSQGCVAALGFDPGGSSTLVVGRETINISPYNPDYETNVWSLPPCPRGVSNVVIGY